MILPQDIVLLPLLGPNLDGFEQCHILPVIYKWKDNWISYYNVTSHMYVLWSLCNVLLVVRGFVTDLWHHFEFVCCLTNIKFMLTSREGSWAKLGMEFCEHMMWRHLFSYLPKGRVHLEILDNTVNVSDKGLTTICMYSHTLVFLFLSLEESCGISLLLGRPWMLSLSGRQINSVLHLCANWLYFEPSKDIINIQCSFSCSYRKMK